MRSRRTGPQRQDRGVGRSRPLRSRSSTSTIADLSNTGWPFLLCRSRVTLHLSGFTAQKRRCWPWDGSWMEGRQRAMLGLQRGRCMRVRRHCSRSNGRSGPAPDRMHGSGLLVLQRRGWMALLAEDHVVLPGDLVRVAGRAGFPRQEIPGKRWRVLRAWGDPTRRFSGDGQLMGDGMSRGEASKLRSKSARLAGGVIDRGVGAGLERRDVRSSMERSGTAGLRVGGPAGRATVLRSRNVDTATRRHGPRGSARFWSSLSPRARSPEPGGPPGTRRPPTRPAAEVSFPLASRGLLNSQFQVGPRSSYRSRSYGHPREAFRH
jgi:hypothetical protein